MPEPADLHPPLPPITSEAEAGEDANAAARRDLIVKRLRAANRRVRSVLVANADRLSTPFTDDPDKNPWDTFVRPAMHQLQRAVNTATTTLTRTDQPLTAAGAETAPEIQVWPLARVLAEVRCGSEDWPWEDEWADLDRRHARTGYLERLEALIRQNGITMPVLVGSDGRLWDGHHRLCIAVRLGIGYVPVQIAQADAGPVDEGDELVCVDMCGSCDACGMEPYGTPAEGWREAARFLRRTARDSGDWAGALHGARLIEAELRRVAEEAESEERPRCPHCQMSHDLAPGSLPAAMCESVRHRIAKAEQLHTGGDHSVCARVDCDVVRDRAAAEVQP